MVRKFIFTAPPCLTIRFHMQRWLQRKTPNRFHYLTTPTSRHA
jgi:hypothetical protein